MLSVLATRPLAWLTVSILLLMLHRRFFSCTKYHYSFSCTRLYASSSFHSVDFFSDHLLQLFLLLLILSISCCPLSWHSHVAIAVKINAHATGAGDPGQQRVIRCAWLAAGKQTWAAAGARVKPRRSS